MISGIYQITCVSNGRRYIGSSYDVRARWRIHCGDLERGKHHNIHLQRAWNKYGEKAFRFKVLEECSVERLLSVEQHYLDENKPEFNIATWAAASMKGRRHSSQTKAKIGRTPTLETRAKMSAAKKGKKGRKHTPEAKAKISQSAKGRVPSNKGKSPSAETRNKLSAAAKLQWKNPEIKSRMAKAISEAMLKRSASDG